MRLDKYLTTLGIGSRTQVKELIKKGKITVNGEKILKPDIHIDENNNRISIADRNRLKLLHYSLDSYQYLSSQPLFNFIYCTWLSDGNIAWVSTSGYKTDKRESYYVKITDPSLNLIGYLYPAIFTSSYGVSSGNLITEYGCNAYLCIPYLPEIQSIKSNCISPVYQFSFDSHHLPSLEWLYKEYIPTLPSLRSANNHRTWKQTYNNIL